MTTGSQLQPSIASLISAAFDDLPVAVEPSVGPILATLPFPALGRLLAAVGAWAHSGGVEDVRIFSFQDQEEELFSEVVIELAVDGDTRTALQHWVSLASVVDHAKGPMSAEERRRFDQCLAVHLSDRHWDDSPTRARETCGLIATATK